MFVLVILAVLIGVTICLQPILNKILLPRLLFCPPQSYQVPQTVQISNNNAWLQFTRPQLTRTACVFFHGNACDISHYTQEGARISEILNCDVFIPEYPQYNVMKTEFPHLSNHACLPTLVHFMLNQVSFHKYHRIILVGQSLGSHFAIQMAAMGLGTDLCLISPFYSIQQVTKSLAGNFLSSFVTAFDSSVPLKKIIRHVPLLVFHGTQDQVIPFDNAKLIIQNSVSAYKQLIPLQGYGHNDLDMDAIWNHVKQWTSA